MTYEPRHKWEYGDPDPVEAVIAKDEHTDHHKAAARGARLRLLAEAIVSALDARALVRDPETSRVLVFGVLADHLYGNHAIDVPELRREEAADRA